MFLFDTIQRCAFRDAECLATRFALTPLFLLAMAHNVAVSNFPPIGALLIWAKFGLRGHVFLMLLF